MKEFKIGEIGVIEGVKVQCIRDDNLNCVECAFGLLDVFCCAEEPIQCLASERSDNTDVIFKRVE